MKFQIKNQHTLSANPMEKLLTIVTSVAKKYRLK